MATPLQILITSCRPDTTLNSHLVTSIPQGTVLPPLTPHRTVIPAGTITLRWVFRTHVCLCPELVCVLIQAMYGGRDGRHDYPSEEARQHHQQQQQMYWMEMERRRQYYMYMQQRAAKGQGVRGQSSDLILLCSCSDGAEPEGCCPWQQQTGSTSRCRETF